MTNFTPIGARASGAFTGALLMGMIRFDRVEQRRAVA